MARRSAGILLHRPGIAGTEVPTESAFTMAFTLSAVGALVALLPTFLLGRRRAPQPVPEAA